MKFGKSAVKSLGFTFFLMLISFGFESQDAKAQECMPGEIRMFAGNFAPRKWAFSAGQLIPIASNQALYSILGTTYGGDGRTAFALPDLRGRVPLGAGKGLSLTPRRLGQKGGAETHRLRVAEIPAHRHSARSNSGKGTSASPVRNVWAASAQKSYSRRSNTKMGRDAIGVTGRNRRHNNMQPFLGINYIICLQGIYPSRN